ncbi:MAG: Sec-independent protein secretion pathway component [Candidatus Saccharibacteria bacterium]|nr:Sec-independent protein secretion pathway component [Candidatus Saccharibacteria bacterium]
MPHLGTPELIIILLVVLLLFGGKKLPELARSVGESMTELRKGANGSKSESTESSKAE